MARVAPPWLILVVLISGGLHALAVIATGLTIGLMRATSEFALSVRAYDLTVGPYFRSVSFVVAPALIVLYLWPVVRHLDRPLGGDAQARAERRALSAPLVVAALGFAPYLVSIVFFPLLTLRHFGRWSPELMSQQVLSPLVNGFLAATTTYLCIDWVFRTMVIPRVVPAGRVLDVAGSLTLRVRGRLLIFLLAVAFTPLFVVLGLVRAASTRVQAGGDVGSVVATLTTASQYTFAVYVALGIALTLLLARTLTRPLREMAAALRRVQAGDLDVALQVSSNDEVGVLASGVNAMAAALREKERILTTFGRVVEPAVRDRLLSGDLQLRGEMRSASVLFCDLRGFTSIAEQHSPTDVLATLNDFFAAMTAWVRECGGFVDKFIGDSLLVVFGLFAADDHDARADSARAALDCALGMHTRLAELNSSRGSGTRPALAVAIGIHSGDLVAGTIGAHDRHEYTIVGDTVNVAARLEQLCKASGHRLLVSESTYELARKVGFEVALQPLESVQLRGRRQPIRVYGLPQG